MSDKTLDSLIKRLKTEAIEAADREAQTLLDQAKQEAQSIVTAAKTKRKHILLEAEQTAEETLRNGETALAQAARDVKIKLEHDLRQLLGAVLEHEVERAFDRDLIKAAVLKVVENTGREVTLAFPTEMTEELAAFVSGQMSGSADWVTISEDKALLRGFSVQKNEEGWSYSITPEEVSTLLIEQLSGKWAAMLKKAWQE